MPEKSFKVQGHKVSSDTEESTGKVQIRINDRVVEATYDSKTKKYSTTAMPYRDYGSVKDLAESLIASHPDFREPRTGS